MPVCNTQTKACKPLSRHYSDDEFRQRQPYECILHLSEIQFSLTFEQSVVISTLNSSSFKAAQNELCYIEWENLLYKYVNQFFLKCWCLDGNP
ncbi:hypothetical protein T11_18548 [Trichinella zimbabwensis]|uniref:Uncharacterized protein n=1 Tax=Trichinella zimbabwensis TaxID=268475 RepID=A0A0V1GWI5_9BILA|nr:hypothetical protein T11_18548 [Trichinella zimbabwensis]